MTPTDTRHFNDICTRIRTLASAFRAAGIEPTITVDLKSAEDDQRFMRLLRSEGLQVELKLGLDREMYRQVTIQGVVVRWPVQLPTHPAKP